MMQKQPAPTARMKLTFHDSDVTNYFFFCTYISRAVAFYLQIFIRKWTAILLLDTVTIPYALTIFVLAVKIKFIIILLIVLTLNEIHVIRNLKKSEWTKFVL